MNEDKKYFPALTGVRAVAASLVFLHHSNPFSVERFGTLVYQFVNEFHVGVTIFFVLSGFLITYRYDDHRESFNFKSYFVNRVARIYPMYFLITTICFAIVGGSWLVYFMNITFLRGFFDDLKFSLVGPGWSLTVEECFYFLAPVLFVGIRKSKWFFLIFPVLVMTIGLLLVQMHDWISWNGFFASFNFMFLYTFFGRCVEFFVGMSLAWYCLSNVRNPRKGSWVTFGGLLLSVLIVFAMSAFGPLGTSGIASTPGIVLNNFFLPVAIAILFYGLLMETSWIRSILSSSPFILLGKSSYVFYLIQAGFVWTWMHRITNGSPWLDFLLLEIIAIGLWRWVEEPFNRLIRKYFKT